MTYEELKVKEMELAEELKGVREELAKAEQTKATNLLEIVIKSLEEVDDILFSPDCYFEVYCNQCDMEFDTHIPLADIIQSLRDLRRGV